MPDLSAFPKSHQVTFKYYLGVIQFLEEDYVKVCFLWQIPRTVRLTSCRLKKILRKHGYHATSVLGGTKSKCNFPRSPEAKDFDCTPFWTEADMI
jgi:hypothetical protein